MRSIGGRKKNGLLALVQSRQLQFAPTRSTYCPSIVDSVTNSPLDGQNYTKTANMPKNYNFQSATNLLESNPESDVFIALVLFY